MLRYIVIFIALVLFPSCKRKHDSNDVSGNPDLLNLQAKKAAYCDMARDQYAKEHRVYEKCDSLLFTSLWAVSCGGVTIEDFESDTEPGVWFRDPDHSCDTDTNSISNDMLLGLILHAVVDGKHDLLQRLLDKSKANNWTTGKCDTQHTENCHLWPTLISSLYDAVGKSLSVQPQFSIDVVTGYRAHLAVLSVILNGMIHGAINDTELTILRDQKNRQPRNAVYQAAYHLFKDGDQSEAIKLLTNDQAFPNGRLPTNADVCSAYKFQRDDAPVDWAPCPDKPFEQYEGVDFVFAVALLSNFKN